MEEKIIEEQKDITEIKVKKWISEWKTRIGLSHWRVAIIFKDSKRRNYDDILGDISCDWRYLNAEITMYHPAIDTVTDEELEQACIHELTHVFIQELKSCSKQDYQGHVERVVTLIAIGFKFSFEAGRQDGRGLS